LVSAGLVFAGNPQSTIPDGVAAPVDQSAGKALPQPPRVGVDPSQPLPGQPADAKAKPWTVAGKHGCNEPSSSHRALVRRDLTKDIDIHEVDWYNLGGAGNMCTGLDYGYHSTGDVIVCSHPEDDTLQFLDLETLALEDTWNLDAANTNCFGNAVRSGVYTNDWFNTSYFFTNTSGSSWSTYANPAGDDGRGMDYDSWHTGLLWEAHSDTSGGVFSLISFSPGATTGTWYDVTSYIPGQMSGLAVFDLEGNTGIAVNCYNTPEVFFFSFDGSDLRFLGSRGLPWSAYTSLSMGLAYSSENGLFYYSFMNTSGTYYVSKLRIDLRALFQDGFERGHTGDWSCDGQCIGGYTFDCNPNTSGCTCFTTTEGYGVCTSGGSCDPALACNSSDDCDPGWVCLTCTACGYDICGIRQCEYPAQPMPKGEGTGMTMSGR
jgi:hypothetical protein